MHPEPGRLLLQNCTALASRDPGLAALLLSCSPDPSLEMVRARSGAPVPVVRGPDGLVPLHSGYDPVGEAERLAPAWEGAGIVVVLGLGGGYHVAAMLGSRRIGAVVVVEKDEGVLRALLSCIPLGGIISDRRVSLLAGTHDVKKRVTELWQPALMGGLRTFALRPWCARHPGFCRDAEHAVAEAVESARADYSVQAHFGKRWFSNMLLNLAGAEAGSAPPHLSSARVAAAGPSLDLQLRRLAAAREEGPLVAVDTSLPALMRAGIPPDAVVSIDCQVHGYHHFLQGMPGGTALYLDLASPPLLARGRRETRFFTGNHPFAAYLRTRWRNFPLVDTTGGNVTHAAVSLALTLGATEITLYGADFSCPAGKSYARGTYLYDVFSANAGRLQPMDGRFYSFLFRTDGTQSERAGDHLRYTTPLLVAYRDRLLGLMNDSDSRISAVPGDGLALVRRGDARPAYAGGSSAPSWSVPRCGWREFLDHYAATVRALAGPHDPPWASLDALGAEEREAWATLLPIAACVGREHREPMGEAAALEAARAWALERLDRIVQAGRGSGHE